LKGDIGERGQTGKDDKCACAGKEAVDSGVGYNIDAADDIGTHLVTLGDVQGSIIAKGQEKSYGSLTCNNTEELDAAIAARNAEAQAERDAANAAAQIERETADADAEAARNKLETDAEKAKQEDVLNVLYSFVDPDRDGPLLPTANHSDKPDGSKNLLGNDYECKKRKTEGKVCWENRAVVVKAFDIGPWEDFKPTENMIIYKSTTALTEEDEIKKRIDQTKYGGICYTRKPDGKPLCFNLAGLDELYDKGGTLQAAINSLTDEQIAVNKNILLK
jgi:hypothetical protein